MKDICTVPLDDGISINILKTAPIRKDDIYGGLRVSLIAEYDTIKAPFTIDVTTGDVITPEAVWYKFRGLMDEGVEFEILAYNIETVFAEKYETILTRGPLSTRPRDCYDVYILTRTQKYDPHMFCKAFWATATHRNSAVLLQDIPAILKTIRDNPELQSRWGRYQKEYAYAAGIKYSDMIEVLETLGEQVQPVVQE